MGMSSVIFSNLEWNLILSWSCKLSYDLCLHISTPFVALVLRISMAYFYYLCDSLYIITKRYQTKMQYITNLQRAIKEINYNKLITCDATKCLVMER